MPRSNPRKITETYLHNAGLHYLERFASGTENFRRIMIRKIDRSCRHHTDQDRAICRAMLETVIEKFQRSGLLDDAAYAAGAARSLRRKGVSARVALGKLALKGIKPEEAAAALAICDAEESEGNAEFIAALRFARRRRIGPFASKDRDNARELATFARAGYSYDIAEKILRLNAEEAEKHITEGCA